jgi:hypothetical protein
MSALQKVMFALVSMTLVGFGLSRCVTVDERRDQSPDAAKKSSAPPTQNNTAALSRLIISSSIPLPLDSLSRGHFSGMSTRFNFQSASLQELTRLERDRSFADAQLAALQSGDPLLFVHARFMTLPCMHEAVMYRQKDMRSYLESISLHPKTGQPVPVSDARVEFTTERANAGPGRLYPPEHLRATLRAKHDEFWRELSESKDWTERVANPNEIAADQLLWRELRAPLNPSELQAFVERRDATAAQCPPGFFTLEFGKNYRAARDDLAARGFLGALMFNEEAGWTSGRTLSQLSDQDYALVARGILEQHPDALALLLLLLQGLGNFDATGIPDDATDFMLMAPLYSQAAAACQIGVANCGPDSRIFKDTCLMVGGCDQIDFASMIRYVARRDGLDASIVDREAAKLVASIYSGDLEALGVRKKPKE